MRLMLGLGGRFLGKWNLSMFLWLFSILRVGMMLKETKGMGGGGRKLWRGLMSMGR